MFSKFIFYNIKIRPEMAEISIWLRKNQKKTLKPNQPNRPEPLGSSYFRELSLYAEFQLPRLCLSCISMMEEKKKKNRRRKENQQF